MVVHELPSVEAIPVDGPGHEPPDRGRGAAPQGQGHGGKAEPGYLRNGLERYAAIGLADFLQSLLLLLAFPPPILHGRTLKPMANFLQRFTFLPTV